MTSKTKFKQTEIGLIPEDWEIKKIGDLADVRSSKRVYMKDYVKSGVPFYRSKEIIQKSNGQDVSTELFISDDLYDNFKIKFGAPEEDDILITSVGTLGVSYRVKKEEKFYFKDGNLTWLRNYKNNIAPLYFEYFIKSNIFLEQLLASSIGSTQQAITIIALKNIKISLPKYEEQSAIAKILSDLDSKIELLQKQNETLEKIGQAIFKHWFVDFEFPNEEGKPYKSSGGKMVESELGEIPEGWSVSKIGKELETVLGGTPSRVKKEYWENGSVAWINSGKINEFRIIEPSEYITEEAVKKSATKLLPKNTVVIAITGATLGQISRLEIDSCANQSVIGILESEQIKSSFIYYLFSNLITKLVGNKTGGAQQHINKNDVNTLMFTLPSEKSLKKYYSVSEGMMNKISKNCFEIKTLQKIRDLLLPKLMTGKIRVPH